MKEFCFIKITNWMHQYPTFIFVIKPYMLQAFSVPIIRGYPLYTWQFEHFMQSSNLTLLGSSHITHICFTKLIMMHGHLNIKSSVP